MAMPKERIITQEDKNEFFHLITQVSEQCKSTLLISILVKIVDHIVITDKGVQLIFIKEFQDL